jgi:hypothetical protein
MTTRVIALALLFAGATAGGALGRRALAPADDLTYTPVRSTTTAAASVLPPKDGPLDPPPPGDGLRLDVTPSRIAHGARGQSLELEVAITNPRPGPAKVKYAVELADDRGRELIAPEMSATLRLASGEARTVRVLTPGGLADGYYVARVTVAISEGTDFSTDGRSTYLHVEGGEITPIDFTTFHNDSRANEAI